MHRVTVLPLQVPVLGGGRLLTLSQPVALSTIVRRVKSHLHLEHVRVATPPNMRDPQVTTVAVCAGSGASVLRGVRADMYLTGELSHHDVLDATARGTAVVLCEHSNTERGFLLVFKHMLEKSLGPSVEITVSHIDRDPLKVV